MTALCSAVFNRRQHLGGHVVFIVHMSFSFLVREHGAFVLAHA